MSQLKRRLDAIEASPTMQQAANRRRFFDLVEQPGIEKYSEIFSQHPELEPLPAGVEIGIYFSHPDPAQLEALPPDEILQGHPVWMTPAQADALTQQFKALGCKYMAVDFGHLADTSNQTIPAVHRDIVMHGVSYADAI